MGQRTLAAFGRHLSGRAPATCDTAAGFCIFPTELGWFGLWGNDRGVSRLTIGHISADEVRSATALKHESGGPGASPVPERDWNPKLRRALENFARGVATSFDDLKVDLPGAPSFHERVWAVTRKIEYGQTVTYGRLAARAGNPLAARAVGAAMASNRIPIIIPCHRVIASGGRIGGFSAPQGIDLKRRMLEMEAGALH